MAIVRTKAERRFNPHVCLFLPAVRHHLSAAKEMKAGHYFDSFAVIVLSALSLEAIGNSYGDVLIQDWDDFESANPKAKLRLIAQKCGAKPDYNKHPSTTAWQLLKFRNLVAHTKRKHLKEEGDCAETDYGQVFGTKLESKIEEMITGEFAQQSADAVEQIIKAFNKTLTERVRHELNYCGREWHVEIL